MNRDIDDALLHQIKHTNIMKDFIKKGDDFLLTQDQFGVRTLQ